MLQPGQVHSSDDAVQSVQSVKADKQGCLQLRVKVSYNAVAADRSKLPRQQGDSAYLGTAAAILV